MFKNFRDKVTISGITVLFIGVALLIFTFFSAYGFLTTDLSPISTQDLIQTFGESLGPLIAAAIHIMYLGVMGWVASLLTIRGVTIMINAPKAARDLPLASQTAEQKAQPRSGKPKPEKVQKPEAKASDPEMIAIPLEEIEQPSQPQKNANRS